MRMNIYLDVPDRIFIEEKAKEIGVSMSDFIRRLISREKAKTKKFDLTDIANLAVHNVKPISNKEIDKAIYE